MALIKEIMQLPFAIDKGVVLEIADYNNQYNRVRYASWSYSGYIPNSANFFLQPKDIHLVPISLFISNSNKRKGQLYMQNGVNGADVRGYISNRFKDFINTNQIENKPDLTHTN